MIRSSPFLNPVGEYPEHQVNLDAIHSISAVPMSAASVFIMAGVTMEEQEGVFSLSLLVS